MPRGSSGTARDLSPDTALRFARALHLIDRSVRLVVHTSARGVGIELGHCRRGDLGRSLQAPPQVVGARIGIGLGRRSHGPASANQRATASPARTAAPSATARRAFVPVPCAFVTKTTRYCGYTRCTSCPARRRRSREARVTAGPHEDEGKEEFGNVNPYEVLLRLDPELATSARARPRRCRGSSPRAEALDGNEPWGRRKLAFEIDKKNEGNYHLSPSTASRRRSTSSVACSGSRTERCDTWRCGDRSRRSLRRPPSRPRGNPTDVRMRGAGHGR